MGSILIVGFLLGLRHALDADHVAAVATLATQHRGLGDAMRQGAAWGIGHTATLFVFGSLVIWLDTTMPEHLAIALEAAVGIMLIALGVDVVRRMVRYRIHFHFHRHRDGVQHFHAHGHPGQRVHDPMRHRHHHGHTFPLRALLVGLMHGMAGSAALIVLTLETVRSPWLGILYIFLFGAGSILGMAALSVVIALPLRASAHGLTWLHNALQGVLGTASVALGVAMLLDLS